jgi:hypothetical protein
MRRIMLLAVIVAALGQAAAQAQVLVFDSETGRAAAIPPTPRTILGEAINLADPGTGAPVTITQMDTVLVSVAAVAYTDLRLQVLFWNTASNATTGATPAFSNLVNGFAFDFGPQTLPGSSAIPITGLTFSPGPTFTSLSNVGVTLNWVGNTGSGLVSTNNLTSEVGNGGVTVGSYATGGTGYYGNTSGETDFNFPGSDYRAVGTAGTPDGVAFRLYTTTPVPEPGSMLLCGLAVIGSAGWRSRRRAA